MTGGDFLSFYLLLFWLLLAVLSVTLIVILAQPEQGSEKMSAEKDKKFSKSNPFGIIFTDERLPARFLFAVLCSFLAIPVFGMVFDNAVAGAKSDALSSCLDHSEAEIDFSAAILIVLSTGLIFLVMAFLNLFFCFRRIKFHLKKYDRGAVYCVVVVMVVMHILYAISDLNDPSFFTVFSDKTFEEYFKEQPFGQIDLHLLIQFLYGPALLLLSLTGSMTLFAVILCNPKAYSVEIEEMDVGRKLAHYLFFRDQLTKLILSFCLFLAALSPFMAVSLGLELPLFKNTALCIELADATKRTIRNAAVYQTITHALPSMFVVAWTLVGLQKFRHGLVGIMPSDEVGFVIDPEKEDYFHFIKFIRENRLETFDNQINRLVLFYIFPVILASLTDFIL